MAEIKTIKGTSNVLSSFSQSGGFVWAMINKSNPNALRMSM